MYIVMKGVNIAAALAQMELEEQCNVVMINRYFDATHLETFGATGMWRSLYLCYFRPPLSID